MRIVFFLLIALLIPLLLGKTFSLCGSLKFDLGFAWVCGNVISLFLYAFVFWLAQNNDVEFERIKINNQWELLLLCIAGLALFVTLVVRKKRGRIRISFEKKSIYENALGVIALLVFCALSVLVFDHNDYGYNLIGYEYLYRLDINQLEYFSFNEVNTSEWNGVFSTQIFPCWIMALNEITLLPPVLFVEGCSLLWSVSMFYFVVNQIGKIVFTNETRKRLVFINLCIVFLGFASFIDEAYDYHIFLGPWEQCIVRTVIFIPLLFLSVIMCVKTFDSNYLWKRQFVWSVIFAICVTGCLLACTPFLLEGTVDALFVLPVCGIIICILEWGKKEYEVVPIAMTLILGAMVAIHYAGIMKNHLVNILPVPMLLLLAVIVLWETPTDKKKHFVCFGLLLFSVILGCFFSQLNM